MNRNIFVLTLIGSVVAVFPACGGRSSEKPAVAAPGGSMDPRKWPKDDHTMCDWKNRKDIEVNESSGPGAFKANVRRVFKTVGEGEDRKKVLVCREIDTNLDGLKDVVRVYNAKGDPTREEADTDYDGRIDSWISFVGGQVAEEDEDTNHDGKADVWKYYVNGQLTRVKRDRNFDGRADVWEYYANGRLERRGIDTTFDGHVDRWDRDESPVASNATQHADAGAQPTSATDAGAPAKRP